MSLTFIRNTHSLYCINTNHWQLNTPHPLCSLLREIYRRPNILAAPTFRIDTESDCGSNAPTARPHAAPCGEPRRRQVWDNSGRFVWAGGDSGSDIHCGIVVAGGDSGSDFHSGIVEAEVIVEVTVIVEWEGSRGRR